MADSPADAASDLHAVVDDETPRREAIEWATARLTAGQTFEDVAAALASAGWNPDLSAEILEEARRQTRTARGALTRDDIANAAERRYRQGMRAGWIAGMPTIAAAMRLLHSLGSLLMLRRFRRK